MRLPFSPPTPGLITIVAGIVAGAAVATVGSSPTGAVVPPDESECDLDGDGFEDLAIGVPGEDLRTLGNAGIVQVILRRGETTQTWHQDSPGLAWAAEGGDAFGTSLACGDFDGDGHDDLAVGVPQEDVPSSSAPGAPEVFNAGVVQVLYGSPEGLTADRDQWFSQASVTLGGTPVSNGNFGLSLAAGDFDGDGDDDLAIGSPGTGTTPAAGSVDVVFGSPTGLAGTAQHWDLVGDGIADAPEIDVWAPTISTGDFDGDGTDDLAIGLPGEDIGSIVDAGGVQVVYGSTSGLTAVGGQWWYQGLPDVIGGSETRDRYGEHLTTGDFDGDGTDDLAVGINGEGSGTLADSGAVHVMYGSASGLTADDDQWWDQGSPGIRGALEQHDNFGRAVSSGDFDADGIDDLAIGVGEEFAYAGAPYAGAVQIIYGTPTGLSAAENQWWDQGTPGIRGAPETHDYFGERLVSLDIDGDGADELAVGVYREDLGTTAEAGVVQVIRGSTSGLTATGNQWWSQDAQLPGVAEADDRLGAALAG